jgi:hypothetical protein
MEEASGRTWCSYRISQNHIKPITRGIIKVHYYFIILLFYYLLNIVTKINVEESSKFTDIHPFNLEQIMNVCTAKISKETELTIRRELDYLSILFGSNLILILIDMGLKIIL